MTEKFLDIGYFVQYWSRRCEKYFYGRILRVLGRTRWGIELVLLEDRSRKKEMISDCDVIRTCNPDQKPIPMYRWYPFFKNPTLNPQKPMYGFFSRKAAASKATGTAFYSTPSGNEVEVTSVSYSPQPDYIPGWSDTVSVGEVISWIRQGNPGREDEEFYI